MLIGGAGADTLRGGSGDDVLSGGLGADQFKMSKGNDSIEDFNQSEGDLIDVDDPEQVSLSATDGGVLLMAENADNSIFLKNVALGDVTIGDIVI